MPGEAVGRKRQRKAAGGGAHVGAGWPTRARNAPTCRRIACPDRGVAGRRVPGPTLTWCPRRPGVRRAGGAGRKGGNDDDKPRTVKKGGQEGGNWGSTRWGRGTRLQQAPASGAPVKVQVVEWVHGPGGVKRRRATRRTSAASGFPGGARNGELSRTVPSPPTEGSSTKSSDSRTSSSASSGAGGSDHARAQGWGDEDACVTQRTRST